MRYEIAADGTFGVQYDNLGRITDLPAKYSGGGKLETSYYVSDLTRSQTQDGVTNTYELDSMGRQRMRTRIKGEEESTEIYHYANGSDSPAWVDEGEGQWSRFIGGIGASAIEKGATEDVVFQLADLHGDIVATADSDIEATELLSTQQFDEYGNPKQKLGLDLKLGWLGSKMRRTELPSGVIQMGVRSYVPALGRFLSPDPIPGGSDNAYEYAAGDPVNNFDLTGEKCVGGKKWIRRCKKKRQRAWRRRQRRRLRRINRAARRAERAGGSYGGVPDLPDPPLGDHLAWNNPVPRSALGLKLRTLNAAVPKVKLNVRPTLHNLEAVMTAARLMGAAWCMAVNGYGGSSPYSVAFSFATAAPTCKKNAWAYVHVPGGP